MKKLVIGFMSFAMAGMMMVPISAEDSNTSLNVSYQEPNTYTVSIPKSIQLNKDGSTSSPNEVKITVSNVNIEPNGKVEVSVNNGIDHGILKLDRKDDTETKVETTVTVNGITGPITSNTVIATFSGDHGENVVGGTLNFSEIKNAGNDATIKAGTYSGKVVFSIAGPTKN